MQAIHLPTLESADSEPAYSFPSQPPPASSLIYTAAGFPIPSFERYLSLWGKSGQTTADQDASASVQTLYLIRVHTTCFTRDELTWDETLLPKCFSTTSAPIPGYDVVGSVEEIHSSEGTPKFKPGDLVWGMLEAGRAGGAADFVIARESEVALAPRAPEGSDSKAETEWGNMLATVPLSALTAWQALFEHGGLVEPEASSISTGDPDGQAQEPYRILITGASGSVGVFMVQLARLAAGHGKGSSTRPVHVTAICSRRNASFVKSLGADAVLSYDDPDQQQWTLQSAMETQRLSPVDLALELTGGFLEQSILSSAQCLKDDGKFISIAAPVAFAADSTASETRQRSLQTQFFIVHPSQSQMEKLASLVGAGKVKGFADEAFPLSRGREAMEKVQAKGAVKRGKVVVRVLT